MVEKAFTYKAVFDSFLARSKLHDCSIGMARYGSTIAMKNTKSAEPSQL